MAANIRKSAGIRNHLDYLVPAVAGLALGFSAVIFCWPFFVAKTSGEFADWLQAAGGPIASASLLLVAAAVFLQQRQNAITEDAEKGNECERLLSNLQRLLDTQELVTARQHIAPRHGRIGLMGFAVLSAEYTKRIHLKQGDALDAERDKYFRSRHDVLEPYVNLIKALMAKTQGGAEETEELVKKRVHALLSREARLLLGAYVAGRGGDGIISWLSD